MILMKMKNENITDEQKYSFLKARVTLPETLCFVLFYL